MPIILFKILTEFCPPLLNAYLQILNVHDIVYDTSNKDGIIHIISMAGYVSILKSISSIDESL